MLRPLYQALKDENKKLVWNEELQICFDKVKSCFEKKMELFIPDTEGTFELETDASNMGLGATLRQNKIPVFLPSRVLKGAEKHYSITERELLAALWSMEKLRYYLLGRKFTLITDHKPLERILEKHDFGNNRIVRWMERISYFDFNIIYRSGSKIVTADALSCNCLLAEGRIHNRNGEVGDEEILKNHKTLSHRKKIRDDLFEREISVSDKRLKQVLKNREKCLKKDPSYFKSSKFLLTTKPGERIAFDLMDYNKQKKIIIGIDFFSGKIFGKEITSKEAIKTIEFIKSVYDEFPFETIQTDNGKEFSNTLVRRWTSEKGIKHELLTPHYHPANGRVERGIRTIREGLKRSKGPLKFKHSGLINTYNNVIHRGKGMTPEKARLPENWNAVMDHTKEYMCEFKKKDAPKFSVGQTVLIKNECKKGKMDDKYEQKGKIVEKDIHDVYLIKTQKGNTFSRHGSHLRGWAGYVDK